MAYCNPIEQYASPPLVLPKPDPAKFWCTVYLSTMNSYTVSYYSPMPNGDQKVMKLTDSQYHAMFSLSHWQRQFALNEQSHKPQSSVTPVDIHLPTWVPHEIKKDLSTLSLLLQICSPILYLRTLFIGWMICCCTFHSYMDWVPRKNNFHAVYRSQHQTSSIWICTFIARRVPSCNTELAESLQEKARISREILRFRERESANRCSRLFIRGLGNWPGEESKLIAYKIGFC